MSVMTPATSIQPARIVLVGDRSAPAPDRGQPAVRRYRLARVRVPERPTGAGRFAHLRRTYD